LIETEEDRFYRSLIRSLRCLRDCKPNLNLLAKRLLYCKLLNGFPTIGPNTES
jgi:hypothetical protein